MLINFKFSCLLLENWRIHKYVCSCCWGILNIKMMIFMVFSHIFHEELINTALNVSKYGVISGPYFPLFGLNTEIYEVNLCIQSEYRKIRIRNNSVFGHLTAQGHKHLTKNTTRNIYINNTIPRSTFFPFGWFFFYIFHFRWRYWGCLRNRKRFITCNKRWCCSGTMLI